MLSSVKRRSVMGGCLAALTVPAMNKAEANPSLAPEPLVFAHRGASALRPEHTLAAYAEAAKDGADYIEPDLVPTKDGVLVVRHECNITDTTDVADHPEFASRKRTVTIDGVSQTGWFTIDFDLAELKTLRARERLPTIRPHNTRYNDHFDIPTFEEMIDFVAATASAQNKVFGIIPEIKNSTFFHSCGFNPEEIFLRTIAAHEYTRQAPLEVQSFETGNLKAIRKRVLEINPRARLMFLMSASDVPVPDLAASGQKTTYGDMMTPKGLSLVKSFADVIGPANSSLVLRNHDGEWTQATSLISDAHKAGLLVHSYTARPENCFLPKQLRNDAGPYARNPEGMIAEVRRYLDMGLDGFFTDDPALGRKAVETL